MDATPNINRLPLGGGRAYLWKSSRSTHPFRLVITAHAETVADEDARAYPFPSHSPNLCFYSFHGDSTVDEGLRRYIRGAETPVERIAAYQSFDYILWKYTNTSATSRQHNSLDETYRDIEDFLRTPGRRHSGEIRNAFELSRAIAEGSTTNVPATRRLMSQHMGKAIEPDIPTDVITISGRLFGMAPVKLSDLLIWLKDWDYNYNEIHCVFCRGRSTLAGRIAQSTLGRS